VKKINILGRIPRTVTLACSGGPDSMAILDFLRTGKKDVNVAYFNHGTDHSSEAGKFLLRYCHLNKIPLSVGAINGDKPADQSLEEWWRNCRYDFFNSFSDPIITCHHLNDVAEWWIFSSLNGQSRLIPYRNKNVIRPFLSTTKETLVEWCERKSVPYVTDPGNSNFKFARSRIRNKIMPEALEINPGLLKVLKKKVRESFGQGEIYEISNVV